MRPSLPCSYRLLAPSVIQVDMQFLEEAVCFFFYSLMKGYPEAIMSAHKKNVQKSLFMPGSSLRKIAHCPTR